MWSLSCGTSSLYSIVCHYSCRPPSVFDRCYFTVDRHPWLWRIASRDPRQQRTHLHRDALLQCRYSKLCSIKPPNVIPAESVGRYCRPIFTFFTCIGIGQYAADFRRYFFRNHLQTDVHTGSSVLLETLQFTAASPCIALPPLEECWKPALQDNGKF